MALSGLARAQGQTPIRELLSRRGDLVLRALRAEPRRQLLEPLLEGDLRRVAEPLARLADVGEAVPDVADAVLAGDLGRDRLLAEHAGHGRRHVAHRARLPAADVE